MEAECLITFVNYNVLNSQCSFVPTDCGILPAPADGAVDLRDGTLYNAVATFTCNDGYRLIGDKTRRCTAKERWNHLTPACVNEGNNLIIVLHTNYLLK